MHIFCILKKKKLFHLSSSNKLHHKMTLSDGGFILNLQNHFYLGRNVLSILVSKYICIFFNITYCLNDGQLQQSAECSSEFFNVLGFGCSLWDTT